MRNVHASDGAEEYPSESPKWACGDSKCRPTFRTPHRFKSGCWDWPTRMRVFSPQLRMLSFLILANNVEREICSDVAAASTSP